MDVVEVLQGMLDHYNRKRELHQIAFTLYKNRDMKVFTIPLMAVKLLCVILPQISEAIPDHPWLRKLSASFRLPWQQFQPYGLDFKEKRDTESVLRVIKCSINLSAYGCSFDG